MVRTDSFAGQGTPPSRLTGGIGKLACWIAIVSFWVSYSGAMAAQAPETTKGSAAAQVQKEPAHVIPQNKGEISVEIDAAGRSFVEIVNPLMERVDLNFVLEDLPLKKTGDLTFKGTLSEALDRACDLFDLEWRISKHGALLFQKRFKDPEEHPQLILPELLHIARDVNAILRIVPYTPDGIGWPYELRALYQSLDSAQIQRLEHKEKLAYSDLSESQRRGLLQAIYSNGFGQGIMAWNLFQQQLEGMPRSSLGVRSIGTSFAIHYLYSNSAGQQQGEPLFGGNVSQPRETKR